MKVIVHYKGITFPIDSGGEDGSTTTTWGQLAQRFCEHQLLHPPNLLPILKALQPDNRMSHYQFRYGDGYATIIKPRWSENGLNCDAEVLPPEDGMIEANITLKPHSGPLSRVLNLTQSVIPDKPKEIAVDLWMEKIGYDEDSTCIPIFKVTQTPFPMDDHKTNVLHIKEHDRFKGVIDNFSIETLEQSKGLVSSSDPFDVNKGTSTVSVAAASKSNADAPSTPTKVGRGKRKKDDAKDKSSTSTKKQNTSTDKDDSNGAKKKAAAKASPKKSAPVEKKGDDGAKKSPAKKSAAEKKSPKKKGGVQGGKSEEDKKEGENEEESSSKKKGATSPTKKKRKAKSEEEGAEKPPPSPSPKKAKNKNEKDEKKESTSDDGDEDEKEKGPKLKRPPNGYMRFASDARPKILEENPGIKVTEVAKKIGEAWHDLSDSERKKYQDDYHAALEEFKAEHPELANSKGKKKVKKQKNKNAKKGDDGVVKDDGNDNAHDHNEDNVPVATVITQDDVDEEAAKSDKESEEKESENEKDIPKRPLNAYMRFSSEMRSKIKEDNPDASPKEMMSKIAEAYNALGEDEKKVYKDAAAEATAKFKEEYGEDALKQNKSKKKKNRKKNKEQTKTENNENGDHGDNDNDKRQNLGGDDILNLPSKPAEGFPDGWVTRSVPRSKGGKYDSYWFSPAKSFKFRSKAEVKRFQERLEEADGDEGKAMKLYSEGKKSPSRVSEKSKKGSGNKNDDKPTTAKAGDSAKIENDGGGGGEEAIPDAWNA